MSPPLTSVFCFNAVISVHARQSCVSPDQAGTSRCVSEASLQAGTVHEHLPVSFDAVLETASSHCPRLCFSFCFVVIDPLNGAVFLRSASARLQKRNEKREKKFSFRPETSTDSGQEMNV